MELICIFMSDNEVFQLEMYIKNLNSLFCCINDIAQKGVYNNDAFIKEI